MSLNTKISDLALDISTSIKSLRVLINQNQPSLSALNTTAKTNLVSAINELKASIDGVAASAGAAINDASNSSTTQTWSIDNITLKIGDAVSALVDSSPTTLDTLNELAAALGDDPNFATTMTTALGNKVSFAETQNLSAPQQAMARDNIDVFSKAEIGDPSTDFVAVFQAGLI